jgi:hypothetical protein
MAGETAEFFDSITSLVSEMNIGLGEAAGIFLKNKKVKFESLSLAAAAHRYRMPLTIHVAIGTDIVAQHPNYDPSALAEASHKDFRLLVDILTDADKGGVVANIGSAVILPEVFLKALTVARNLNKRKRKLITADFDMIAQYRPQMNVVKRPTVHGGRGFSFIGHHEIMIPLLTWGLKAYNE